MLRVFHPGQTFGKVESPGQMEDRDEKGHI